MFDTWNYIILFAYLAVLMGIGLRFSGKQKSTEDYFLAGSSYALVGGGHEYVRLNYQCLLFPWASRGSPIARISPSIVVGFLSPIVVPFLIWIFYPFYRNLRITPHTNTSVVALVGKQDSSHRDSFAWRAWGWLGVVIYSPSLALSVVTGVDLWLAILLIGTVATAYAMLGGISAVIWTDVLQFMMLVGGAILGCRHSDYGGTWWMVGNHGNRWRRGPPAHLGGGIDLFRMTGLAVMMSYFFQLMQDYGTDQLSVQRLMTIKDSRGMAKAAVFNSLCDLVMVSLLLFVGIGIFAYFHAFPEHLAGDLSGDRILPYYIVHALPVGVSGLLIAAIFAAAMSSVDSGVNSLATVIVNDFVKPLRQTAGEERKDLKLARLLTLAIGIFALGTASYVVVIGEILKAATSFLSLFAGPILSLFLLGMLTKRAHFRGWLVGLIPAMAVSIWVQNWTAVHFLFYFPFCFGISFGLGYLASCLMSGPTAEPELTLWGRRRAARVSKPL